MSSFDPAHADELAFLLADRATGPLDTAAQRRLAELLDERGIDHSDVIDLVAAEVAVLAHARGEAMPAAVRTMVLQSTLPATASTGSPGALRRAAPWMALAACLALLLAGGWWWAGTRPDSPAVHFAAREALVRSATDLRTLPLRFDVQTTGDAAGQVIWSEQAGRAYVTFEGLPALDPKHECYHLWIVTGAGDAEARSVPGGAQIDGSTTLDGGYFDLATGDCSQIVPVDIEPIGSGFAGVIITRDPSGPGHPAGPVVARTR
jgi:hypothetical protein